jgi:hypothetical protein
MALLTRKGVIDWLEKHYFHVVGDREQDDRCPLANYIIDTHPLLIDVSVNSDNINYRNKRTGEWRNVKLPKWAQKFVTAVDFEHDIVDWEYEDYSYEEWNPITEEYELIEDYEEYPVRNTEVYGYEALEYIKG